MNTKNHLLHTILVIILISGKIFAQNFDSDIKFYYSNYITEDNNFEICVVDKIGDLGSDLIQFKLILSHDIGFDKVILRNSQNQIILNSTKQLSDDGNYYEIVSQINPEEYSLINTTVQLDYQFIGTQNKELNFEYGIEYFENGFQIGAEHSGDNSNNYDDNLNSIKFYKSQKISGNALQLNPDSNFDILIPENKKNKNLLIEFWAKFDDPQKGFLEISDESIEKSILDLSVTKYQTINYGDINSVLIFDDPFIGKSSWHHMVLLMDFESSRIKLYLGDRIVSSKPLSKTLTDDVIRLSFKNNSNSNYYLESLRFIELKNHINFIFKNKHNLNFRADSSNLLFAFDFDSKKELNNYKKGFGLEYNKIEYNESDAPIFSRSPKINVDIFSTFYSIEWQNQDLSEAKSFIVQKSYDDRTYEDIHYQEASDGIDNKYFYSDPIDINSELLYYRLKQVNNDNSIVYSSSIKIGQGEKKHFQLDQNYPNPFNPITTISLELFEAAEAKIVVYDIVGKKIETIFDGYLNQGIHKFNFDGTSLPSGIYFYEVKTDRSNSVKKMILAK